jgi:hypothetical protein
MLICPLPASSRTSRPQHATNAHIIYTVLNSLCKVFLCAACLEACLHVCWCLALLENAPVTWVHNNCLDSLTSGLKQTTTFCIIAHLCHDLYQGVLGWFCGFAWELELTHSCAHHPAIGESLWPGPGASASDRALHLALQAPTSHQARKRFWSTE